MNKSYYQKLESYKRSLAEARKSQDEAQRKVRDCESMLSAKDKIINDLRLQVKENKQD